MAISKLHTFSCMTTQGTCCRINVIHVINAALVGALSPYLFPHSPEICAWASGNAACET